MTLSTFIAGCLGLLIGWAFGHSAGQSRECRRWVAHWEGQPGTYHVAAYMKAARPWSFFKGGRA